MDFPKKVADPEKDRLLYGGSLCSDISLDDEPIPFEVGIKEKVIQVSSGGFFSMILTEKGELYAWGASKNGFSD